MKSELVRSIEKVLRDAHPQTRWESLESFLERQFGDESQPKLDALQEYIESKRGTACETEVALMVQSLKRELGVPSLREQLSRKPKPKEEPVAVKKPKARARTGFQAAKQSAAKAASEKAPKAKRTKKASAPKKSSTPRKPTKPVAPPPRPRPIYDQLAANQVVYMPRTDLVPWPGLNPRTVFDEAELQELADSIHAEGVRVPLVVKLNPKPPHWIAYGERRWRAAKTADITDLPVIVMSLEEREAFLDAVLENAARKELSPIEEARSLARLKEYYPDKKQAELGAIFGHADQPWVSNRLRLLKLPADVLQLCDDGIVSATALRDSFLVFLSLTDEKKRAKVWKSALAEVSTFAGGGRTLPLSDDQVAKLVGTAAYNHSLPLGRYEPTFAGAGVQLVTVEAHAGCGCGGPKFAYNGYSSDVRCFDAAWHKEQAAKVRARLEKKEKKQEARQETVTGAAPLGEKAAATWSWPVKQEVIPQKERIPPHSALAYYEKGAWIFAGDEIPDVELLDPELVYQVESTDDEGRPSVDLIYLDRDGLDAAVEAFEDTVAGWVAQRKQAALELELTGIGHSRITPADLVELLSIYEVAEDIEDALRDLGAQLPKDENLDQDDYVRAFLEAVEGDVLVRAALLVAHRERVRRASGEKVSRYARRREEEAEVTRELGAIQMAKLLALLSFVPKVIEHPTTEETGANGGEWAGAEEGDEADHEEEAEAAGAVG